MSTATPARFQPPRHFENAAEWIHALGDVPLERIIFDPWPGTATESDLLHFVERDKLCELIDGTLVEKPVRYGEAIIAMNLVTLLGAYVSAHRLGAVSGPDGTMRLVSSGRVRLPDVSFVSTSRLPTTLEAIPTLAPDLAVEVLSPGNTKGEIDQKLKEYFESGTRLAWVIDPPTRTVAVYHPPGLLVRVSKEDDALDGEDVLPGFTAPVAELFRNVPRQ